MNKAKVIKRHGFTIVELLVVITIIGIISGIALAAIGGVLKNSKIAGMKTEISNIEQAIEGYKTKYGDYPPDFSNWDVVRRHYLKIFPDIDANELLVLYRLCDTEADASGAQIDGIPDPFFGANNCFDSDNSVWLGPVMDRAEALVWALGGFSSDPKASFYGTGGPLALLPGATDATNPASYYYNTDRSNALLDMEPSQLSIKPFDPSAAVGLANRTESNDEPTQQWGGAAAPVHFLPDLFPVYRLDDDQSPVVYFDARTYAHFDTIPTSPPSFTFNGYATYIDSDSDLDGVRPLYSELPNLITPAAGPSGPYSLAESLRLYQFMNNSTFQVLAPGADERFGAITDLGAVGSPANPSDMAPTYFQFPGGKMIQATGAATPSNQGALFVNTVGRFDLTGAAFSQRENTVVDNLANFSDRTFEDQLP